MPQPPKRLAPVPVRLALKELERLDRDRGDMSRNGYIRWRLFDPDKPPPRHRGKSPVKDHQALAEAIGRLGQSRIASNLNQLAKAANSGSLYLSPDVDAELREALLAILQMRTLLIEALGLADGRS